MDKIIEFYKKNKSAIIAIFLVCLFCYYFIWTISQPFNSCPDEGMKWDICKYIFENNGDFRYNLEHDDDILEFLSTDELDDCFQMNDYLKNVDKIFEKFEM